MSERWETIPHYEFYEASNLGRVRTKERTIDGRARGGVPTKRTIKVKILSGSRKPNGITYMLLRSDGERIQACASRLIFAAFCRVPDDGEEVSHKDFNVYHDRLSNLICLPKYESRSRRNRANGYEDGRTLWEKKA